MKKVIAKFIFFAFRWKADYPAKFKADKCVMLASPHTSNWDLIFALGVYWMEDIDAKFLIKNNYTKGLGGSFFKWLGAIGVDRSKHNNLVEYAIDLFNESERLVLMVPAEGTRNKVEKWKTGFYHIAHNASVPVAFGFLDYKRKLAGVGDLYTLTGKFEQDMQHIEDFYRTISAKFPEKYNPSIY